MGKLNDLLAGFDILHSEGLFGLGDRTRVMPTFTGCPERIARARELFVEDGFVLPEVPRWVPERDGHYPYPWDMCEKHLTLDVLTTEEAECVATYLTDSWKDAQGSGVLATRYMHSNSDWSAMYSPLGTFLAGLASVLPYLFFTGIGVAVCILYLFE